MIRLSRPVVQSVVRVTSYLRTGGLWQALVDFRATSSLEQDPRFDEMWTLVRSEALLSQRLVDLDHQVMPMLQAADACPENLLAWLSQVGGIICVRQNIGTTAGRGSASLSCICWRPCHISQLQHVGGC